MAVLRPLIHSVGTSKIYANLTSYKSSLFRADISSYVSKYESGESNLMPETYRISLRPNSYRALSESLESLFFFFLLTDAPLS